MTNKLFISGTLAIIAGFLAHEEIFTNAHHQPRQLNSEEQELANEARAEIAQVLERNLIKFFTLVAADNGRELFSRQADDYEDEVATLNPNVLPQVAQILSAIFNGGLNISKIVDRTLTFAPVALRQQVEGVFDLLLNREKTTTTVPTTKKPKPKVKSTTSTTPKPTESTTIPSTTSSHILVRYKIKNKKNRTSTFSSEIDYFPEDDELYRLEQEVISAAIDAEPYVRGKEPRVFRGAVKEILTNFDEGRLNLTQVIRFLPDLFQGARKAFNLLENLGQLAGAGEEDDDY